MISSQRQTICTLNSPKLSFRICLLKISKVSFLLPRLVEDIPVLVNSAEMETFVHKAFSIIRLVSLGEVPRNGINELNAMNL